MRSKGPHLQMRCTAAVLALVAAAVLFLPRAHGEEPANLQKAIFAGGCFWCMQPPFDHAKGVKTTVVGYTGGKEINPSYEQVSAHKTGHREAIEVTYDPARISYSQLLDIFWHNINPTQADGQFHDIDHSYTSAIYYLNDEQKKLAEETKKTVAAKFAPRTVYTEIVKAGPFYKAEDYHQKYYKKNEARYKFYRWNCGRDQRIEQLWGKKEQS